MKGESASASAICWLIRRAPVLDTNPVSFKYCRSLPAAPVWAAIGVHCSPLHWSLGGGRDKKKLQQEQEKEQEKENKSRNLENDDGKKEDEEEEQEK